MPDRSYPRDAIGNQIKVGDILQVALPTSSLIFRVQNIDPAGSIVSPGQEAMALTGTIYMVAMVPLPFTSDAPVRDAVVLKQPEMADGPSLVKQ